MLHVGIDEAGYGPNLGPLVLSAVVLRGVDDRPVDIWSDSLGRICRAGGPPDALWIDDSKAVYRAGSGLDRLEAATLAVLRSTCLADQLPISLQAAVERLIGAPWESAEFPRWLNGTSPDPFPHPAWAERVWAWLDRGPLEGHPWRLISARSAIIGPEAFDRLLGSPGSKSRVHADGFRRLLRWIWRQFEEEPLIQVRSDKHGGRHFYADGLAEALPEADVWIVEERPSRSSYVLTGAKGRQVRIHFEPRADADDGAVALASILSKTLRERWMRIFNDFWKAHVPGLKPTAGYPVDARRFRDAIEPACERLGFPLQTWWRAR